MAAIKRAGEDYVQPLPDFKMLPPLPPVRSVDPDKYVGACRGDRGRVTRSPERLRTAVSGKRGISCANVRDAGGPCALHAGRGVRTY
jgi:hypothetical protein